MRQQAALNLSSLHLSVILSVPPIPPHSVLNLTLTPGGQTDAPHQTTWERDCLSGWLVMRAQVSQAEVLTATSSVQTFSLLPETLPASPLTITVLFNSF